ncbi:hypothetical protein HAX54_032045 [Datura stramonium]|uniref:Putative plant transposon protein domain-containing protein n=1 Tax=Datura stramonium TaxID=4076 RepID=A0ABS8SCE5_DATST|nr:hypothetical protein [Datura stramonium]
MSHLEIGDKPKGPGADEIASESNLVVGDEVELVILAKLAKPMVTEDSHEDRANTTEFDYRMREQHNQHPWLAQIFTDGQPSWLKSSKERIFKSSLTFTAKFWWEVVWLQLFSTGEDNALGEDRVVLAASLMLAFPLNMRVIIANEINIGDVKLFTSLPFTYLITQVEEGPR